MFRIARDRRAGPFLEWKVRIFVTGAVLGLAGIFLDERWMVGTAIVVLVLGMALRFLSRGPGDAAS